MLFRFSHEKFIQGLKNFIPRNSSLTQRQVSGIKFLLDSIGNDPGWECISHIANFFGQVSHECNWTFQPIREIRGEVLTSYQKRYWNTGFYGRGYIQITWENNYRKAGNKIGVDLVQHPERALDPDVSYKIASRGMREGWFTGKKLSDFLNGPTASLEEYQEARSIVNGKNEAALIARYSKHYEKVLNDSLENIQGHPDEVGEPMWNEDEIAEKQAHIEELKSLTAAAIPSDADSSDATEHENQPDSTPPVSVSPTPDGAATGTPAPPNAALSAQAVVGGRPEDPPKEIPLTQASLQSRVTSWLLMGSTGPLATIFAKLGGIQLTNEAEIGIIILAVVGLIAGVYLWDRSKQRAHELNMLQGNHAAQPSSYNVAFVQPK